MVDAPAAKQEPESEPQTVTLVEAAQPEPKDEQPATENAEGLSAGAALSQAATFSDTEPDPDTEPEPEDGSRDEAKPDQGLAPEDESEDDDEASAVKEKPASSGEAHTPKSDVDIDESGSLFDL